MKFILDENLPVALAEALAALFQGTHQIAHIRTKFGPGVTDLEWINALSHDDRWIVISGDTAITRKKAERQAFLNSRLVGFFLAPGLMKAKVTKKMERLMVLWDRIETIGSSVAGGALFELPMKSSLPRQLKT